MYKIKLFEEFKSSTLNINNSEYDNYYNTHKTKKRHDIVAWGVEGSQEKNFKLVSKYIKNNDSLLDYGCGIGDLISYLNTNNIEIKDYLGVDINNNFINMAKETYPDNNFKLINNVNQINGKWDIITAVGVFTWFIDRDDFIETINKLHDLSNKEVLITCLYGNEFWDYDDESDYSFDDNGNYIYEEGELVENESYWEYQYRNYDENMFKYLFPNLKMEFDHNSSDTMLVRIIK